MPIWTDCIMADWKDLSFGKAAKFVGETVGQGIETAADAISDKVADVPGNIGRFLTKSAKESKAYWQEQEGAIGSLVRRFDNNEFDQFRNQGSRQPVADWQTAMGLHHDQRTLDEFGAVIEPDFTAPVVQVEDRKNGTETDDDPKTSGGDGGGDPVKTYIPKGTQLSSDPSPIWDIDRTASGEMFTRELASQRFVDNWAKEGVFPNFGMLPQNANEAQIIMDWAASNDPGISINPETNVVMFQGSRVTPGTTMLTEPLANFIGVAELGVLTPEHYRTLISKASALESAKGLAQELISSDLAVSIDEYKRIQEDLRGESRAAITAAYQTTFEELKQKHALEVTKVAELEKGIEARKTARVTGQESRATLDHEFNLMQGQLEDNYQRTLQRLDVEDQYATNQLNAKFEAERGLLDRKFELDLGLREAELEVQIEEAALDRALQLGQLEEISLHNRNLEILQAQTNELKNNELKINLVSKIAENPTFLYYAKGSGMLGLLASALGGPGAANDFYKALTDFIPEDDMKFGNIQEMNRMSGAEQAIRRYGISARKGLTDVQQQGAMLGAAPVSPLTSMRYVRPEFRAGRGMPKDLYDFSSEAELDAAERGVPGTVMPGDEAIAGAPQIVPLQPRAWENRPDIGETGYQTWREQFAIGAPQGATTKQQTPVQWDPALIGTAGATGRSGRGEGQSTGFNWNVRVGNEFNTPAAVVEGIEQAFIEAGFTPKVATQMVGRVASEANQATDNVADYMTFAKNTANAIIQGKGFEGNPELQQHYMIRMS